VVDELVIPYKGKYCQIRQFLKNKPIWFGIKVWALVSSTSHFVGDIRVYEGKGTGGGKDGTEAKLYAVVRGLLQGLENHWHSIIMELIYISTSLPRLDVGWILDDRNSAKQ
jgi:hypothetical protein